MGHIAASICIEARTTQALTGGLQQVDQSLQKMAAASMAATAGNLKDRGEELSAAIRVFEVGSQPVHGHEAFAAEETFEHRQSLAA